LHERYRLVPEDREIIKEQIRNLKRRLSLIKQMQAGGILSFFFCVLSMLFFYLNHAVWAYTTFGLSLVLLMLSLIISLNEIYISTRALEIELRDMES
jgi:hypothetical protein